MTKKIPKPTLVACITGAGSGIGKSIAIQLANDGHTVFVTDIDSAGAENTAQEIRASGGISHPYKLDVSDEDAWIVLLARIDKEMGGLDTLVNNAGVCISKDLASTSLAMWKKIMSVNLEGTFLGMKHGIPLLAKSGGGSIINISSVAGVRGIPGLTAYCASKAGVIAATKAVAMECAQAGNKVRVNVILPGAVETPIWIKMDNDGELAGDQSSQNEIMTSRRQGAAQVTPLGFSGQPQDIASMVSFLASKEARFITGAEFTVDGGARASA